MTKLETLKSWVGDLMVREVLDEDYVQGKPGEFSIPVNRGKGYLLALKDIHKKIEELESDELISSISTPLKPSERIEEIHGNFMVNEVNDIRDTELLVKATIQFLDEIENHKGL